MQSTLPAWVNRERLEHVVVLALDDHVVRLVAAAVDRPEAAQARVDRLAEVGDHHQRRRCGGPRRRPRPARRATAATRRGGGPCAPSALPAWTRAPGRWHCLGSSRNTTLAPGPDRVLGQAHPLGKVRLEDQAEGALGAQAVDVGAQVGPSRPRRPPAPRDRRVRQPFSDETTALSLGLDRLSMSVHAVRCPLFPRRVPQSAPPWQPVTRWGPRSATTATVRGDQNSGDGRAETVLMPSK